MENGDKPRTRTLKIVKKKQPQTKNTFYRSMTLEHVPLLNDSFNHHNQKQKNLKQIIIHKRT